MAVFRGSLRRAEVAQNGAGGSSGGDPELAAGQRRVIPRIDAAVDHAPAMAANAVVDHPARQTTIEQLPRGNGVRLARRERSHLRVHFTTPQRRELDLRPPKSRAGE